MARIVKEWCANATNLVVLARDQDGIVSDGDGNPLFKVPPQQSMLAVLDHAYVGDDFRDDNYVYRGDVRHRKWIREYDGLRIWPPQLKRLAWLERTYRRLEVRIQPSWRDVQQHLRRIANETDDGICFAHVLHGVSGKESDPNNRIWRYRVGLEDSRLLLPPISELRAASVDKLTYSMDWLNWITREPKEWDKTDKTPRRFDLGDELYRLAYRRHQQRCYRMGYFRRALELALKRRTYEESTKQDYDGDRCRQYRFDINGRSYFYEMHRTRWGGSEPVCVSWPSADDTGCIVVNEDYR